MASEVVSSFTSGRLPPSRLGTAEHLDQRMFGRTQADTEHLVTL